MSSDDAQTKALRTEPLRTDPYGTDVDPVIELVDVEDVTLANEVGRFQPVGVLGRGGMGEVRLMRDLRIRRPVAFKVLRSKLATDRAYRTRFLTEARIQGQLEHPSIVPVHDLGETSDGELYIAMKCVRGATLRRALKDPKFTRRRLLTAFSSVCLAVEFAHRRGVVHRDLKPENVMLGDFGEVYVLDWGIAKVLHAPAETPLADTLELPGETPATRTGIVLGTPNYMAPERRDGTADERSDVFALGVILNELLAAHPELDVPPELVAIVERASAHLPEERFASARELHDALERYLDGDRDLETRKTLAAEHARRAAAALDRDARDEAGHEVGRALGLDPQNQLALRTLMRLLTDVPAELPPAANAEFRRHWLQRRQRVLRASTLTTLLILTILPLILWMGVRDATLAAGFVAFCLASVGTQYAAARSSHWLPLILSYAFLHGSMMVLASSMGMLGIVPAGFAILAMAIRMNYTRTIEGVLLLLGSFSLLAIPMLLVPPHFVGGNIVITPVMHAFPPAATTASLVLGMFGTVAIAVLYGRLYSNEIQRADRQLVFHAWQLRQLLPPAP